MEIYVSQLKEKADIYAINKDGKINFVGFAGHIAFHHADHVGGDVLIKVDYEKFLAGKSDFIKG